jgi:hypothetical protein
MAQAKTLTKDELSRVLDYIRHAPLRATQQGHDVAHAPGGFANWRGSSCLRWSDVIKHRWHSERRNSLATRHDQGHGTLEQYSSTSNCVRNYRLTPNRPNVWTKATRSLPAKKASLDRVQRKQSGPDICFALRGCRTARRQQPQRSQDVFDITGQQGYSDSHPENSGRASQHPNHCRISVQQSKPVEGCGRIGIEKMMVPTLQLKTWPSPKNQPSICELHFAIDEPVHNDR